MLNLRRVWLLPLFALYLNLGDDRLKWYGVGNYGKYLVVKLMHYG